MKSNVKILSIGTLLVMSLNACSTNATMNNSNTNSNKYNITNNDQITSETRKIGSFNAIDVSTGIDVVYYPTTAKPYVEINLDAYNINQLKTEVSGNKLKIYFKNAKEIKRNGRPMVIVHGPIANSIEADAGASISIEGDISVKGNFELEASSGGSIKINKNVTIDGKLEMEASSGSSISWNNNVSAKEADIETSSGASIKGGALIVSQKTEVDVSSASKCSINNISTSLLDIDASSSAHVTFSYGKVEQIRIDASTASSVNVSNVVNKGNIIIDKSTGASVKAPR